MSPELIKYFNRNYDILLYEFQKSYSVSFNRYQLYLTDGSNLMYTKKDWDEYIANRTYYNSKLWKILHET